jgi:Arc/MetJ-type ribon-helix-helix transcriptional regulator
MMIAYGSFSAEYDHTGSMNAERDRVTVSLPNELVQSIDRWEKNRSKFIAEAVRHELDRRRRAELRRSLQNPHPESVAYAEQGLEEWTRSLPEEDTEALVDHNSGKPVRWVAGEGWVEGRANESRPGSDCHRGPRPHSWT